MSRKGILYILPGFLGDHSGPEWLCSYELSLLHELNVYFTENERTSRRFLRKAGFTGDLNQVQLHRLDKDTSPEQLNLFVKILLEGKDAGILSEAGMPALADPGTLFFRKLHHHGIQIIPIPGPSSILLAIAASGLNGQQFSFHGYLPVEGPDRIKKLKNLEEASLKTGYAQFFIETPFRNNKMMVDILQSCRPETLISIAANLNEPNGWNRTLAVQHWKNNVPELHKIPVVFGLLSH
jgi:16S rRNA (cytidine1402-2'-O)-methyltransferase